MSWKARSMIRARQAQDEPLVVDPLAPACRADTHDTPEACAVWPCTCACHAVSATTELEPTP